MYRIRLTEEQRAELDRRTRSEGLKPRTRTRLELLRWLAAGATVPEVARQFRCSAQRVRYWVRQFLEHGFDALADQPHQGRPGQLTPERVQAIRQVLAEPNRTWTLPQLAAWLADEHGVRLTAEHLGTLLRRAGLSCRRTEPGLAHKRDPEQVRVREADLRTVEKGAKLGAWTSVM